MLLKIFALTVVLSWAVFWQLGSSRNVEQFLGAETEPSAAVMLQKIRGLQNKVLALQEIIATNNWDAVAEALSDVLAIAKGAFTELKDEQDSASILRELADMIIKLKDQFQALVSYLMLMEMGDLQKELNEVNYLAKSILE